MDNATPDNAPEKVYIEVTRQEAEMICEALDTHCDNQWEELNPEADKVQEAVVKLNENGLFNAAFGPERKDDYEIFKPFLVGDDAERMCKRLDEMRKRTVVQPSVDFVDGKRSFDYDKWEYVGE